MWSIFLSSSTWKHVSSNKRKELLEGDHGKQDDGEFWMSFEDLKKHFTDFEVCSVSVNELYEDDNGKHAKKITCRWQKLTNWVVNTM